MRVTVANDILAITKYHINDRSFRDLKLAAPSAVQLTDC